VDATHIKFARRVATDLFNAVCVAGQLKAEILGSLLLREPAWRLHDNGAFRG
jgi:hypothetical protein